jgi:hypothetical protein
MCSLSFRQAISGKTPTALSEARAELAPLITGYPLETDSGQNVW